jgi:Cu/Ag efflux protein CusF
LVPWCAHGYARKLAKTLNPMGDPMRMKILAAAVAATLSTFAFGQASKPEAMGVVGTAPGKGAVAQVVKASATVDAIDAKTRSITLKLASGEKRTIVAGDQVKNFDQIHVGDTVSVGYVEALTVELLKGGKKVVGRTESKSMEKAKPGEKPAAMAGREITAVADVVNVDEQKRVVTVKNKDGKMIDLNVRDPEQLKLVKKGDQVQATYTEAMAISVDPTPPPKPAAAPKK